MSTMKSTDLNDFQITDAGSFEIVEGNDEHLQTARQYMQARRGEMIHRADDGIAFDPIAFGATANPAQYEAAGRKRLLQVQGITEVTQFETSQDSDNLEYVATFKTIEDEEVTINGGL